MRLFISDVKKGKSGGNSAGFLRISAGIVQQDPAWGKVSDEEPVWREGMSRVFPAVRGPLPVQKKNSGNNRATPIRGSNPPAVQFSVKLLFKL
jgi:hypothetical protein